MATTNMNLDEIVSTDKISSDFLQKTNSNMQKIDTKYGELKNALLQQTGKSTLAEAIVYIQTLADTLLSYENTGNATASQMLAGVSAIVKGTVVTGTIPSQPAQTITPGTTDKIISSGKYLSGIQIIKGDNNLVAENIIQNKSIFDVTGTAKKIPNITVNVTGSYASNITGYGAGIDQNGTLVIWAMSNTTNYEHINFVASSVIGTKGAGWDITDFSTADPINVPYACTLTGIFSSVSNNIIITLDASSRSNGYDYITLKTTVTGS